VAAVDRIKNSMKVFGDPIRLIDGHNKDFLARRAI
jgi:hypothetical protein